MLTNSRSTAKTPGAKTRASFFRIEIPALDATRVEYVVERVDRYAKTALDVEALFRVGPARLHLVRCGGEWNPTTRHYEDNVVAVARRTSITWNVAYPEEGGQ